MLVVGLVARAATGLRLRVEEVSKLPGIEGFVVLPQCWVIEHFFSWLSKYCWAAGCNYKNNLRIKITEAVIKACLCYLDAATG